MNKFGKVAVKQEAAWLWAKLIERDKIHRCSIALHTQGQMHKGTKCQKTIVREGELTGGKVA